MSDSDRACATRPLAIFGRAVDAAHLALRRVLRAKERDQSLIVIDYQGAAAALLDETNRGNLHKTPLLWCDLANRRINSNRPLQLEFFSLYSATVGALRKLMEIACML